MAIQQSDGSGGPVFRIGTRATPYGSLIGPHWRKRTKPSASAIRLEAAGYIAMLAFLLAHLLNVVGAGYAVQAALNLVGAVIGALYLRRKKALPSVISNVAWAGITVVGLILGR